MFALRFALLFVAIVCSFVYAQDSAGVDDVSYDWHDQPQHEEGINNRLPYFRKICGKRALLIKKEVPYRVAQKVCHKLGGRLLAVTTDNFKCFTWYLHNIYKNSPIWIGSWNGERYKNKGIALVASTKYGKGAVVIPPQKELYALCEKRIFNDIYEKPIPVYDE